MTRVLVPDELWSRVGPLLPPRRPHKKGGRPWCSDRATFGGVLLVLRTGLPWEGLPQNLSCSSMTCGRRLRDWKKGGVWDRLQGDELGELGQKSWLDWSHAALGTSSVAAKKGAPEIKPNPTDREKDGSKHHVLTDRRGFPLTEVLTAANVNETTTRPAMLD